MIETRPDGSRWANDCALCRNERKTGIGAFRVGQEPECSWCRSVREHYGSYWYPIDKTNEHLFPKAACGVLVDAAPGQEPYGWVVQDRFHLTEQAARNHAHIACSAAGKSLAVTPVYLRTDGVKEDGNG